MKNAFGLEIYDTREIVTDKTVEASLRSLLLPVFTYLGIPANTSSRIIADCLLVASNYSKLEEYEDRAHRILEKEQVAQKIPQKLQARANLLYSQIQPYLLPGNVLDYGCGDGQVAEFIAKKRNQTVTLTDVYEHSHVKETGLVFQLFKQGAKTQFNDNQFDNTLALTVFHHSSDPLESIQDVNRVTKKNGRILVIESVYDVRGEELSAFQREKIAHYLSLSGEQQRKVNIFFDHFYNRILHYSKEAETKVNVPFNFNTPQGWKGIFAENGLKQESIIHLGLDQPTVPEYHTLHVLRKA